MKIIFFARKPQCRKVSNIRGKLRFVKRIDPGAFYTVDQAENVSKMYRPLFAQQPTGWRAVFKKK